MTTTAARAHAASDVSFDDIVEARRRIAGGVMVTPCVESPALSAITGARIFCKQEYQQRAGLLAGAQQCF